MAKGVLGAKGGALFGFGAGMMVGTCGTGRCGC
jgi:hypothetical protein